MNASFSRKVLHLVSLSITLMLLTGCWDREEVNDLALVMAAGFDKKNDKTIELSIQVFIPRAAGGGGGMAGGGSGGGGGGAGQTLVRSAEGTTIADAMSKLQEKLPRRIFWGHCEVFVIGEKIAKKGIREHIDFIMRDPEPRERADVFVSKGKAKAVMELLPPLERSSAEVLRELAKTRIGMKTTVNDLAQMLTGDAGTAALPWLEILPPEPDKEKQTIPYITGTAVFKKDKMVGRMDDKVTRGLLWLRNEIKIATVTIKPKEADGHISMRLLRSKTELIPEIKDKKWIMTVRIETEDDVVQNTTNLNLTNPKFVKKIENDLNENIERRVKMALAQGQHKFNADIFGVADAFHRKYPKQWNEAKEHWDEIFPEIEVNIEAKARILRPGMSSEGAVRPEKEVKKK
ncbi:germination protein [Paenibacillus baekrokdamisoli]|uniref:Germination protein n=1 Tax=Paenibacillus baekrokdamisoli TaxID=1712516 RepID=A0A3G9J720_9BACL|nr:Ger(x)C family spore germination protein [Paenibacillus baekrokdamisoli]MBB3067691.1 spore germination protein KC [Paenibacillus baekrokdamisoli]BBH19124.1 germination protein [Paenibacillus baekrokdamisoli]